MLDKSDLAAWRAEGRKAVDRFVRGTSLLEPGEEAQSWVPKQRAQAEADYAKLTDPPPHVAAFMEGFREAADEAVADLHAYRCRLNGWSHRIGFDLARVGDVVEFTTRETGFGGRGLHRHRGTVEKITANTVFVTGPYAEKSRITRSNWSERNVVRQPKEEQGS